jgi:CheY-like chemotaxis protein
MVRILSVSYDVGLLYTRRLLLEARGYSVTSALGLKESLLCCQQGGFDLFILGHSIPLSDKQKLINEFRATCPGAIISLSIPTESDVDGADHYVDPDPKSVLELVAEIATCATVKTA